MEILLMLSFMFLWHMRGGWNPIDAGITVARLVFLIIPVGAVLF